MSLTLNDDTLPALADASLVRFSNSRTSASS